MNLRLAAVALMIACGTPKPGAPAGVEIVELMPDAQATQDVLEEERIKAASQGRKAYIQLYADWCNPCRALRDGMSDPRMQDAFAGTYIVRLQLNHWDARIRPMVGEGDLSIPAFYEITEGGHLGRKISGTAWGEDTVENMAPPLKAYFHPSP